MSPRRRRGPKNGGGVSTVGGPPLGRASDQFNVIGGVDNEFTEDADEAVLHLHSALPTSMYVVLDVVRGYGPRRRAIQNSWACCECIFVREGCEVGVCVCVCA